LCYKHAGLVVACSKGMEEGVKLVNPNCETIVIPNSSDVGLFSTERTIPTNFPADWHDKKIFLYAGSLGLMDECSQILHGIATVTEPDFKFGFIGDGAERGTCSIIKISQD
jgi:glycosyltransferase involved in cell wall biosynthesis